MKLSERNYKRIVIKIGSSLFFSDNNEFNHAHLSMITKQIGELLKNGKEVVIVSSGAIAFGMHLLHLRERPRDLFYLQAIAAIGQNKLMNTYSELFSNKFRCAQILLTWEDFNDRERYLNAKNTLFALLKYGTLPVVNENDTVSTDEIKFGDNDHLSSLVATLIGAELLIILSDVDGLLGKKRKIIPVVDEITPQIRAFACPTNKKTCVGGMVTKIEAAKIAMDSGIPCVIANGRRQDIILSVINEPENHGTLFSPKKGLAARERWIAFGTKPKGRILVDDGARNALLNKKSLLSVGVTSFEGNFDTGDIVSIIDRQRFEFARGKAGISSRQLDKVKGSRFDKEVIHRDNIVIL